MLQCSSHGDTNSNFANLLGLPTAGSVQLCIFSGRPVPIPRSSIAGMSRFTWWGLCKPPAYLLGWGRPSTRVAGHVELPEHSANAGCAGLRVQMSRPSLRPIWYSCDLTSDISISGLVVEYIVAIDVTRVRFPADACAVVVWSEFRVWGLAFWNHLKG